MENGRRIYETSKIANLIIDQQNFAENTHKYPSICAALWVWNYENGNMRVNQQNE